MSKGWLRGWWRGLQLDGRLDGRLGGVVSIALSAVAGYLLTELKIADQYHAILAGIFLELLFVLIGIFVHLGSIEKKLGQIQYLGQKYRGL